MSFEWLATHLVASFLLPPLNALLPVGLGWLWMRRHPRLARFLVGAGGLALWAQALPLTGDYLLRSLEGAPLDAAAARQAQAIVVLGGGRYRDAPEYGGDTVSEPTLSRLRYAAKLQRETGLPLLVTGGLPDGGRASEADAMRVVLETDFGVPVKWVESASINTAGNARFSADILRREGVTRVLLVTHAWHMRRSGRAFAAAGLAVSPAPTFFQRDRRVPQDYLPQAGGLRDTRTALHEWIGLLWYALRTDFGRP